MDDSRDKEMLAQDREDVLAVLQMRFGEVPPEVVSRIEGLDRYDSLQRLILVAANAADWGVFLEELEAGDDSFRLLGERFDPMAHNPRKG